MSGVPLGELSALAVAIVAGGVVTGLLAGLFGIGGGAIIVPVLYEIFRVFGVPEDVRMQLCVGTSLAIIVPTSIRSFLSHRARGELPMEALRLWALPLLAAIVVGAGLAALAPAWVFKLAFATVTGLIALRMFFGNENWRLGNRLPGPAAMAGYGFIIGLYAAVIGAGGGSVSTMVLMLYGTPIHAAVGISAGVGVIISLVGTIGYMLAGLPHQGLSPALSLGYVSLVGFAVMAPISTIMAPLGARLAHQLPKRQLEIAFGVFLLAVALRFVVSLM
jgi:uncharacterized membrane protein YfcA